MSAKSIRRFVAGFASVVILFGQLALTAYACPVQFVAAPVAMVHGASHGDAGEAPCAGMDAAPVNSNANACEVHCTDGVAIPAAPDLPPVVLTALPAATAALAELGTTDAAAKALVAPVAGAPPPTLKFCRLLI